MPHKDGNRDGSSRRNFLKWASAIGLTGIAPTTISEIATAEQEREREMKLIHMMKTDRHPESSKVLFITRTHLN